MKTIVSVLIATLLLIAPAYAFSAGLGYMRISYLEGDVQIKTPEAGDWGFASINGPLAEGDQVWTPQGSRAELQLNNGTYIRLDENSALQVLSTDRDSSQFYLSQGGAYIYYEAPRGSIVQIDTPDTSVRAFNRSIFRLDKADSYTGVTVYKGYVKAENNVGATRINAGQLLSLGLDTNGEIAPLGPSDEWEEWNNARNRSVMARGGGGSRYLPADLRSYSADLDANGRWFQVPEYGYCWVPTVAVGADWAPYRNGRWIWRGGDYVWVGSEPWGWAPYHYGRWSFSASFGWCWVPPATGDVYWSPGYVGWVRTPDYVAWVPLAPGERYYGRGYYGPNSVNITNVSVTQVNINYVYKNVNINNGVTVINRNSFNTASPTIVNVNRNVIQQKIFVKNNISVGAPDIRPSKASYFVSARPVPPAKLPPQPVRNVRMGELRQSRPFIKEADKSVLNPAVKAQPLKVTTVSQPRTPVRQSPNLRDMGPAYKGGTKAQGAPVAASEKQRPPTFDRGKPNIQGSGQPVAVKPQPQPFGGRQYGTPTVPAAVGQKPVVQTQDRRMGGVQAGAQPQVVKLQPQPFGGRQFSTPTAPGAVGQKPVMQTQDRRMGGVQAGAQPQAVKPQPQPFGGRQFGTPAASAAVGQKPVVQTQARRMGGVQAGAHPQAVKPQPQAFGGRQFGTPATLGALVQKPAIQTQDKGKAGIQGGPALQGEKPHIQPGEKGEHGGAGARGEKKPDEAVEGVRKGQ